MAKEQTEEKDASKKSSEDTEDTSKKSSSEDTAADKTEKESDGSEDTDQKASDNKVFGIGLSKGDEGRLKKVLKMFSLKDEAGLEALAKAHAKVAEEEAKKSGNGELHAQLKVAEDKNAVYESYFETKWEKASIELAKLDKDFHDTIDKSGASAQKKLEMATVALKSFGKSRKKVADDPLNPAHEKWLKDPKFMTWFREAGYTGTPRKEDHDNYLGIHQLKK